MSEESIKDEIDQDYGLKSQKRLLTIVSIILLAMSLSGTKIVEANTFILKLEFTNQEYLAHLLFLSVIFLMIRYHSYANHYHVKLYQIWTGQLLGHDFVHHYCEHSDQISGIVGDVMPSEVDNALHRHDSKQFEISYKCSFFLNRFIVFTWADENLLNETNVSIFKEVSFKGYCYLLIIETNTQLTSFFKQRENLDIMSPYLIGLTAIISFLFPTEFRNLLSVI